MKFLLAVLLLVSAAAALPQGLNDIDNGIFSDEFDPVRCEVASDGICLAPPEGQRCAGRNYGQRRCCTPHNPCDEGEGDCDGSGDGSDDGNKGCKGDLVCGSNNCKQFGHYYHEKDDCCEQPNLNSPQPVEPAEPTEAPPPDQRCKGRNYGQRRCCSPENPCDEGEGDCDGPLDGGLNDGHAGCKGDLVCGSNNCKKFGSYYHDKDDCCEKPNQATTTQPPAQKGWGEWSAWIPKTCPAGFCGGTTRTRTCPDGSCRRTQQTQDRNCVPCGFN